MNKYTFIITLFCSILFSCQKESVDDILDETIYVRHQCADMPAYVHGNQENKTLLVVIQCAGSFGLSLRDEHFNNRLEDDFVVVYFDSRGQSMSQGHYKKPENIINLMASDVSALTKVLKHKYGEDITLFLMGHSLGGLITCEALINNDLKSEYNGWINVDGLLDMPSVKGDRTELLYKTAEEQIDIGNSVSHWKGIQKVLRDIDIDTEDAHQKILNQAVIAYKLIAEDQVVLGNSSIERTYQNIIKNNPIT